MKAEAQDLGIGTSELIDELLCRDSGLLQDSAQSANGQFCVERHDAARYSIWPNALKHDVTPTLPNLDETQPFENADRFCP